MMIKIIVFMNVISGSLVSSTILHSTTRRDLCFSRVQVSFTLWWKPEIIHSKTIILIECNVSETVPFYILWGELTLKHYC
jgi:hypothetical protein